MRTADEATGTAYPTRCGAADSGTDNRATRPAPTWQRAAGRDRRPRTPPAAGARSGAAPWLALGVVYVMWGSTYLAIRYTIETRAAAAGGRAAVPGRRAAARGAAARAGQAPRVADEPAPARHRAAGRAAADRRRQRAGDGRRAARRLRAGRAADRLGAAVHRAAAPADRGPAAGDHAARRRRRAGRAGRAAAGRPRRWAGRSATPGGGRGWCCWPRCAGRSAPSRPPGCRCRRTRSRWPTVEMLVGGAVRWSVGLAGRGAADPAAVSATSLVGLGLPVDHRLARRDQRVRLRPGHAAGVHGGHLRLREPGDRGGARRGDRGGAVHPGAAGRRRGGRDRRGDRRRRRSGCGECSGCRRPSDRSDNISVVRRTCASQPGRRPARRAGGAGFRRRPAGRAGHPPPAARACSTGSGCCSSTR